MEKLRTELDKLIKKLKDEKNFRESLKKLISVYPFNEYEYIISTLLAQNIINYKDYITIRDEYINRNLYLYLFEMAPRTFGDTWGLAHISSIEPSFKRPSKKIDKNYQGEYDLYLNWKDNEGKNNIIKIEVKSSRVTDRKRNEEPLIVKAISSKSGRPFLMNFQQLKPKCCNVFIWIAVYRDQIRYWVIRSDFVQKNKYFTPQHRGPETADRSKRYKKEDIYEGQIMISNDNIKEFDCFIQSGNNLKNAVIEQYKKQIGERKKHKH